MWGQMSIVFLLLIALPSFSLAQCSDSEIYQVKITKNKVQWAGDYDPSCIDSFDVCWCGLSSGVMSCKEVPATSNETTLFNVSPCENIWVQVMAVGENLNGTTSIVETGHAGPPSVSGLSVADANRTELRLTWSSVAYYTCVNYFELWICENVTSELSGCIYKTLDMQVTELVLHDYKPPVCRFFNASMRTVSVSETSDVVTTQIYVPSDNQVFNATVVNVTSNSALLEYSLLVVDHDCPDESLEICYKQLRGDYLEVCASYPLEQGDSSGLVPLTNLSGCTAFTASLRTKQNRRFTVDFTTLKGDDPVLTTADAYQNDKCVSIQWTTSQMSSCVLLFNVSWSSNLHPELSWSNLSASTMVYDIITSGEAQTLFVKVAVIFLDGDEEYISLHKHLYSSLPYTGSSIAPTDSTVLIVISAVLSLRFFGVD